MKYTIYTLSDPRDNNVKYVGITKLPLYMRLEYHMRNISDKHRKSSRLRWLRELVKLDSVPVIKEVETAHVTTLKEAGEREQWWIDYYNSQGCGLLNTNRGGGGLRKIIELSEWATTWLGKRRDVFIAEREGISTATVGNIRKRRDIPTYRDVRPVDTESVQVRLRNSEMRCIKKLARGLGIGPNDFVRRALTDYLQQEGEDPLADCEGMV